jgi:hypothetical protein
MINHEGQPCIFQDNKICDEGLCEFCRIATEHYIKPKLCTIAELNQLYIHNSATPKQPNNDTPFLKERSNA